MEMSSCSHDLLLLEMTSYASMELSHNNEEEQSVWGKNLCWLSQISFLIEASDEE